MRREIDLLKRTAGALAFGTALLLGAGTITYVEAHDQYYDRGSQKHAEKRHQKNEKQALKEHQREESRYYGNDRAIREHQRQERDELKYHQRNEKDRLNQRDDYYYNDQNRGRYHDYERDDYYYNDQNRGRYSRDRY